MLNTKDFEQETKYSTYQASKDDLTKINYVRKRFMEMQQNRSIIDKDWDIYQTMIDAIFTPYPDERSSSVVPLSSAIIELFVADALKLKTEYNFKGENSEYNTAAKALEYIWKYDFRRKNRQKVFLDNEYITAWFWTSIIYTWFEKYYKEQYDPIMTDDVLTRKKVRINKEDIIIKNIDIRQFYIDNQALNCIDEASDCILEQWVSYEKFQNFKNNPLYKNTKYVNPVQYDNDYKTFVTTEEASKIWDYVKLRHYWNVEKDAYMVIANDSVLIREQHILSTIDWEKALPFVIRILWKKNYSIYWRWLCEWLMMFNSEINNLRELIMDWIRRSNTQVLAIWKWLSFDWRSFSYDNEILTFDWNLANNFQQISWNPPNQAIFQYLQQLYKDIAVFVWIDIQNIIWEPQQTAFQTEVQREASQKRINVWLTNRDIAFERFANLYKDLLQKYFPRKDAEWLYPKIEIEWEELRWDKFRKKKWKSIFEVTPEILRWDIYIDVYTNVSAPTINAVDREQKVWFISTIWNIAQWYAMAKQAWIDLETILPIKTTLSEIASDFNLQPEWKSDEADVKEAKNKLFSDINNMMMKPWMESWMKAPEQWQPIQEQPTQGQPAQWQPLQANQQTWQNM